MRVGFRVGCLPAAARSWRTQPVVAEGSSRGSTQVLGGQHRGPLALEDDPSLADGSAMQAHIEALMDIELQVSFC